MEDIKKNIPYSLESEQCVIGSILLDADTFLIVDEVLNGDDFYIGSHKIIYDTMAELNNERIPIDVVTLSERIRNKGLLDQIGGVNYLTSTTRIIPTTSNVKTYADIVKEKSILRRLIEASGDIMNISYNPGESIEEILNIAEKKIFDISQDNAGVDFNPINEILKNVFKNIEDNYNNGSEMTGLDTGFKDLNDKLGGFHKSDLILIAARPGMGKTAFALNLVANAALRAKAKVAVFSLEMSKEQLVQRLVSAQSNVELKNITTGKIADNQWSDLIDAMKVLGVANIYIDDSPGIKMSEIRTKCRKLKIDQGLDMIMIDYLQLMEGDGKAESRQQEVSKISRGLKILAKEMDCPVLALSQLSRNTESTKDHTPKLSDLRDSGAIEQDADIVMFIYREDYYEEIETKKKNIADIKIAKNRHGELSTIELVWISEIQKFKDKAKEIGS